MSNTEQVVLLLDVGNSRVKWILQQGESMLAGGDWNHQGALDTVQLAAIQPRPLPTRVVVACVAGEHATEVIGRWGESELGLQPELWQSPQQGYGLVNAYAEPVRLGIDRWVAMVAARQCCAGYLCVVNAGSALTLDLLDPAGNHLGGYILPGISRMPICASRSTSLESGVSPNAGTLRQPGTRTADCLTRGALHAACSVIEQSVARLENEVQQKVQCVLAGGDSALLAENLQLPHIIEPALVLKGLRYMVNNEDCRT